ncbi:ABC transporter substrate-binding protein [Paenibacillus sp. JDR-2]|uniref:ABC transporter substrate-binding protein n=1 Tax=Paenibacillus sp. (strain JDR-2) TaxID=324057 RepID=UPI0001AAF88B|nr:sugar ABC transporter substrate-binding protein [Paenibacillus sp. JDR-2]ACT02222.1 extracellular solute-binding protein family 1 [Paenibacillus sp. JDR-2]
MRKTAGVASVTLLALSVLMAGCGSSNGNNGNSGTNGNSEVKETSGNTAAASTNTPAGNAGGEEPVKHDPVTLKYTFWGSPNEKKVQEAAIKSFTEKYPWIKVNTLHIPESYTTKLTTMASSNQMPDIGLLNGDVALEWASQGRIYNIMDFLANDPDVSVNDILPNTMYYWEEGKLAGVNGALEAFALFYNKEAFTDAGLPLPPTKADEAYTWDQFVETAQKLTLDQKGRNALDPDFDPKSIKQFGVTMPLWAYMNGVVSNGGQFVNQDGTQFKLADPEAAEAIQQWADLINKYHVAPSPTQSKNIPSGANALSSRKVAMTLDGQWSLVDLGAAKKLNFGIGVAPVMKNKATMTLGEPIVIFKDTKHPEEAWMLYKWMMNPENTLELQTSGLWMPVLKKWYENADLVAKWAAGNPAHPEGYQDAVMRNAFDNGFPNTSYYVKNLSKINSMIDPALEQVWLGKTTAQEALSKIKPQVEKELKGVYTER